MENIDNTNPMPASMSPMPPMSSMNKGSAGGKKSTVLVIILAVAVLAFIFWWVSRAPQTVPTVTPTATATVQEETLQEVNELDLGDVDSEFQQIDQDLNTL